MPADASSPIPSEQLQPADATRTAVGVASRAFVTGGTGLLGVNLVRQLVQRGQRVRVLVRPTSQRIGLDSELIEFAEGDVTDAASIRRAMAGCDQVYHLAAWVQISPWGLQTARRINVEGTRHVCQAALEHKVGRLVHASSIATMAAGTLDEPADEDTPWNIAEAKTPYYLTKLESERVVLDFVDQGLDAVIANPTYLVGPWDIKPSAGRMLMRIAKRRLPIYPKRGGINYVDVRRAATGHILAMQKGQVGRRYILGGENMSFAEYAHKAAAIAGVSPPRVALPFAAIAPFAAACSLAGWIFPHAFRDLNMSVLRSAFMEHYVKSDRARDELGYEVAPVTDAIRTALDWFQKHAYMP